MAGGVRDAFYAGLLIAVVYLIACAVHSKGRLNAREVLTATGLAFATLSLPGPMEMIVKALGSETLPIFNSPEDRVTLVLGGGLLVVSFFYGLYVAFKPAVGRT